MQTGNDGEDDYDGDDDGDDDDTVVGDYHDVGDDKSMPWMKFDLL